MHQADCNDIPTIESIMLTLRRLMIVVSICAALAGFVALSVGLPAVGESGKRPAGQPLLHDFLFRNLRQRRTEANTASAGKFVVQLGVLAAVSTTGAGGFVLHKHA